MTCCQGGPNTEMSILSAHGLVGIVSLRQEGRIVTYEVVLFTTFSIRIHLITMI